MADGPIYNDAEWLRARYIDDRMSMAAIAKLAGCYPARIFERLRRYQIPTRSRSEAADKRVDRACGQCGKAMQVKPCLIGKGIGRFCSRPCKHANAKTLTEAEAATHVKAREILNVAVVKGQIKKPGECSSCAAPGYVEGHHPDHSKPLDVEWLCLKCHGRRHRKRQPV